MKLLSDETLVEAFKKANALQLDKEFIQMIKLEMSQRNLIPSTRQKKGPEASSLLREWE
ncbi:sporulation histidine kinase inhibitor Sda [Rossellomorea aquimaris]|uniref:sporulation histidine kinase inhibitor Sda n=1 Tax=Rossellomorea aquimaris TaxID=189382 RepID=UPI0009F95B6E|nr:sporulation histidine kinase inhibitor Sda [Rossellomorea aquimaris]